MTQREENDYVYNVATTLSMKINNDIEEFLVCSVSACAPLDKQITVNAKKIYEAIEKQIPKKPNSIFCPVCNFPSIIDGEYGDRYPYCYNCGQAIDWTEDNE